MSFREIDMRADPRSDHFAHFRAMEDPFVTMTVPVRLTDWLPRVKAAGYPFFLSFQYAVVRAANRVPALRRRIRGEGAVEYDFCNPSYTVALPDGTYRYCNVRADLPFERYLRESKRLQEEAVRGAGLTEEGDVQSYFFVSCAPWVHYSALQTPRPGADFSIPCFTWGKYAVEKRPALEDGRLVEREEITLPLTLMVNHALVDGRHIGQFFAFLEEELPAIFRES